MTEFHVRYGGAGVMIYWHVEKGRVCIYSQLKSCSSSEVAAMIEGLLRHCTTAEIQANYTDTHGASVVGFAFTELLRFRLLPRLKTIGSIRLYSPDAGPSAWPRLERIVKHRAIDWALIARNYDQMVKYEVGIIASTASLVSRAVDLIFVPLALEVHDGEYARETKSSSWGYRRRRRCFGRGA